MGKMESPPIFGMMVRERKEEDSDSGSDSDEGDDDEALS